MDQIVKPRSKIEKLMAELCANGVEFLELGKLATVETGTQLNRTAMTEVGKYPVLNGGINPSGFHSEYNTEANTIAISQGGASAGYVNFVGSKFWAGAHCFVVEPANEHVENKYLFYVLKNGQQTLQSAKLGAGIPGLSRGELRSFKIPIPPLEIQHEIVAILDNFTELKEELEKELEKELEARRAQYGYYRDSLLAFAGRKDVRWAPMGEIGEFIRGRQFTKDDVVPDGIASIHYGEIYTHYGTSTTSALSHVGRELAPRLRFAESGDVVIAAVGETVEDVCKAVAWLGDGKVAVHDDCYIFRHPMDPKFVSYWFQTATFHAQKNQYVARAKVKRMSGESLGKITIPVPSIREQERIVSILDKFDSLLSDISFSLPAELSARRKQYEYYRAKLLTFAEYVRA